MSDDQNISVENPAIEQEQVSEQPIQEEQVEATQEQVEEFQSPLAKFAALDQEENQEPDMASLLDHTVKNAVKDAINQRASEAPKEIDPIVAIAQELKALKEQLQYQTQSSQVEKEVAVSQEILKTYVNDMTALLTNQGITMDNNPFLYEAMNGQLTAGIMATERQLGRALKPKETVRILKQFEEQWTPKLAKLGVGKAKAPANATNKSPIGAVYNNQQPTKQNAEEVIKKIQETNDLDELIKMGIRPTPRFQ